MKTTDKVSALLDEGKTKTQIAKILGLKKSSISYHCWKLGKLHLKRSPLDWISFQIEYDSGLTISACAKKFSVSKDTVNKARLKGHFKPRHAGSLSNCLVKTTKKLWQTRKTELINSGLIGDCCRECGQSGIWNNKCLRLQIDHINGDPRDNRIENLRLLCPNCHSQTPTWGRKRRNNVLVAEAD